MRLMPVLHISKCMHMHIKHTIYIAKMFVAHNVNRMYTHTLAKNIHSHKQRQMYFSMKSWINWVFFSRNKICVCALEFSHICCLILYCFFSIVFSSNELLLGVTYFGELNSIFVQIFNKFHQKLSNRSIMLMQMSWQQQNALAIELVPVSYSRIETRTQAPLEFTSIQ